MNLNILIAIISLLGIVLHLLLSSAYPLFAVLVLGGLPLLFGLLKKAFKKEFGSDLIAGVAIVTSVLLAEYLAGTLVVLMLSGGAALENFAMLRASSVLRALAKRMPSIAHSKQGTEIKEIPLETVAVDDTLVVFPHEICPVDGIVIEGHGSMDESYLTGEPFQMTKTVGSVVISGSVNGESALSIRATHKAVDSRYAKITEVMRESEQKRPQMRRLGDKLGALYTPVALLIAGLAWYFTGDPLRFLSVMVVATPCPLLIGVPVAIIGSISLAASRGIIVKSPVALEQVSDCTVAIFDKTGTLTYGEPELVDIILSPRFSRDDVLSLVAGLERYSKHPLSRAILACAKKEKMTIPEATQVNEPPGQGLTGIVNGRNLQVTSRKKLLQQKFSEMEMLAPTRGGLECVILIDNLYAATFSFHDAPRRESKSFVSHLEPRHQFKRVMIVSGDRESEVKYLAEVVGIQEIYAQKSPEEKVEIVRAQ